jgi:TonB family protein
MASTAAIAQTSSNGDERKLARRSVVECGLVTVEMSPAGFGLMVNVCEQGIGVYTLTTLERGEQVQVLFHVPGSTARVEGLGEVTWAANSHAGLRLKHLNPSGTQPFTRWIGSLPEIPRVADPLMQRRKTLSPAAEAIRNEINESNLDFDGALAVILERMMQSIGATGGAIALGNAEQMICCASAGLAPEIGVRISSTTGLTGECIRTGRLIHCRDTESDTRVDREICRQLNLRSSVMVPIKTRQQLVGVLEAFSSLADGFDETHVSLLRELAELTAGLIEQPQEKPLEASPQPVFTPVPVQTPVERPLVTPHETNDAADLIVDDADVPLIPYAARHEESSRNYAPSRWFLVVGLTMALVIAAVMGWSKLVNSRATNPAKPLPSAQTAVPAQNTFASVTASQNEMAQNQIPEPRAKTKSPAMEALVTVSSSSASALGDDKGSHSPLTGGSLFYPPVEPEYPEQAKREKLEGDVVVQATVSKAGLVEGVGLISGDPVLGAAAINAVRQWRYEPFQRDGTPVEAETEITLHFSLQARASAP